VSAVYRIEQINQRPVRKKRSHKKHGRKKQGFFAKYPAKPAGKRNEYREHDGPETPAYAPPSPERTPLRSFLRAILPAIALLAAAAFFLFVADWSWAGPELPVIAPRGDTLFEQDLASYIGILPERAGIGIESGDEIPLDLAESLVWKTYRVKKGDTVEKIAHAHGLRIDAIIAGNGMANANKLYEGQELRVPNMDGVLYTVKRGDSLSGISGSMGVPLPAILDANDLQNDAISPGTKIFIPGARMRAEDLRLAMGVYFKYPISGRLTSPFGWRNDPIDGIRKHHAAIDLAAPTGTTVKAAMDGKVSEVGYSRIYGNFIVLSHGKEYKTLYAHLSRTSVVQGASVSVGGKIGEVGSTGYSTGPHLHFAIYKNKVPVNPLEILK
jgi:murein DD-endopeptidase MepM/ murein hydrolase activator NlpD